MIVKDFASSMMLESSENGEHFDLAKPQSGYREYVLRTHGPLPDEEGDAISLDDDHSHVPGSSGRLTPEKADQVQQLTEKEVRSAIEEYRSKLRRAGLSPLQALFHDMAEEDAEEKIRALRGEITDYFTDRMLQQYARLHSFNFDAEIIHQTVAKVFRDLLSTHGESYSEVLARFRVA